MWLHENIVGTLLPVAIFVLVFLPFVSNFMFQKVCAKSQRHMLFCKKNFKSLFFNTKLQEILENLQLIMKHMFIESVMENPKTL